MGFEIIELGELIETISVTHKFLNDEVVFLNTSDIFNGIVLKHEYSKVEGLPGQAKKSIRKDDILYSEIRPKNKRFAYVDFEAEDYVVSTKLMVLRVKNKVKLSTRFLYHYLTSVQTLDYLQGVAESRSGTFPQITFSEVSSIKIKLPSIKQQNKIVTLFDDFESKIQINNKVILNLEKLAQTLFKRWFVDFEFPTEKGEPYKSSGGEMVESEFGMIPEGWGVKPVSKFSIRIQSGGTPRRNRMEFWDGGTIPWIKTKEIKNNYIIRAEENITELGLGKSSAKLLEEDTVLVAMYGATAGQLAMLKFPATTNQACCGITTKYPNYLYQQLLFMQEYIKSQATGSAQQNLSKEIVSNLKVLSPNIDILTEIEKTLKSFSNLIEKILYENEKLVGIRETLLPKLLSGEIEIPDETEVTKNVPIS